VAVKKYHNYSCNNFANIFPIISPIISALIHLQVKYCSQECMELDMRFHSNTCELAMELSEEILDFEVKPNSR